MQTKQVHVLNNYQAEKYILSSIQGHYIFRVSFRIQKWLSVNNQTNSNIMVVSKEQSSEPTTSMKMTTKIWRSALKHRH